MTNYEAGARFERETRAHLAAEGYWVMKSAGSKTKVDLIAIKEGELLVVQCKRNGVCSPAERAELLRIAHMIPGAIPLVASRPRVTFRRLIGTGPREWVEWTTDEVIGDYGNGGESGSIEVASNEAARAGNPGLTHTFQPRSHVQATQDPSAGPGGGAR